MVLTSSTYTYFWTSSVDLSQAVILQSPINQVSILCENHNLSPAQKELLLWHYHLGHLGLQHVQSLLANQQNPVGEKTRIIQPLNGNCSHVNRPMCAACQFSKQKHTCPSTHTTGCHKQARGLSDNITHLGQRVSCNLYCPSTPGCLPHTFGKESQTKRYTGGAIFVHHATKYIFNLHQLSTTATESVLSKHAFESFCSSFGIKIKQYIADNQPFASVAWKTDCANQQQTLHFLGVGAHHQNFAEWALQTIFDMSKTMFFHFAIHWPEAADTELWPFAMDHAVYLWNRIPKSKTKLSSINQFTEQLHFDPVSLQRLHVFGCPVYVLDPQLQDGKKLPKWTCQSCCGIFLGYSKEHDSNVALVINLETGKISPQYHLVFDNTFSTIFSDGQFTQDVWDSLVHSILEGHIDCEGSLSEGESVESVVDMPLSPLPPSQTSPGSFDNLIRMVSKFTSSCFCFGSKFCS